MTILPEQLFPLRPALPLPEGVDEEQLFEWLQNVRVEGAPPEIANYCKEDFRRFVYTYGLVRSAGSARGECLELGANPYFATMLLKEFTDHQWSLANYFGAGRENGELSQDVDFVRFTSFAGAGSAVEREAKGRLTLGYQHFNIEEDAFPYADATFDIVLFSEIIEHLLMDPVRVLRKIRRVLKPSGQLILTTPNVSRLENVAKMIAGANIYDSYSGDGAYGRRNREYNKHELWLLLGYLGFEIEEMFTADVHENLAGNYVDLESFQGLVGFRSADLGQYIFVRASRSSTDRGKRPAWLYRRLPVDQLE